MEKVRHRAKDGERNERRKNQRDSREPIGGKRRDQRVGNKRREHRHFEQLRFDDRAQIHRCVLAQDQLQQRAHHHQTGRQSTRGNHCKTHRSRGKSFAAQHAARECPEGGVLHVAAI